MTDSDLLKRRLEIISRLYQAFNARDPIAGLAVMSDDFEWHPNPEEPEQRVTHSRDEALIGMQQRWAILERLQTEVERVEPAGDQIAVAVHHRAVVQGSDAVIERREVHLWSFRGNQLSKLQELPTWDDAMREAHTP